jgi:hypothetical protein
MSALLIREKPGPLVSESDELAARIELRRQIARLELRLGRITAEAFTRLQIETGVEPVARVPRALGLGDLERVRDDLAIRVGDAEAALTGQGELETKNRELLDDMLAKPADHKWLRISRASVGEPGCGYWHSRPRFGLLGMLMGWWRVKISSGCPL